MDVSAGVEAHGLLRPQGSGSGRVRLMLPDLGGAEELDGDPVPLRPPGELGEDRLLRAIPCHDQDPAGMQGDAPGGAVAPQLAVALDAEPGLHRVRLDVVAGMDDARVPAALMEPGAGFLLEH